MLSAVLMVVGVLLPAPAQADVWYGTDGYNPRTPNADIKRVRVDHAPRKVYAKVRYYGQEGYGERLRVYLDTRRRNPGPEFVLSAYIIVEATVVDRWSLHRIDNFRQGQRGKGEQVRCRGDRVSLTKQSAVFTQVPRRCLEIRGKAPRKVRASLWAWGYDHDPSGPYRSWHDWAPGRKQFGPWLKRA